MNLRSSLKDFLECQRSILLRASLSMTNLVFVAWTERRRRRDLERVTRETGWSGEQWGHEKSHVGSQAYGRKGLRHEAGAGKERWWSWAMVKP